MGNFVQNLWPELSRSYGEVMEKLWRSYREVMERVIEREREAQRSPQLPKSSTKFIRNWRKAQNTTLRENFSIFFKKSLNFLIIYYRAASCQNWGIWYNICDLNCREVIERDIEKLSSERERHREVRNCPNHPPNFIRNWRKAQNTTLREKFSILKKNIKDRTRGT